MQLVQILLVILVLLLKTTNSFVTTDNDGAESKSPPVIDFTNLRGSQAWTGVPTRKEERNGGGAHIGGYAVSNNPVTSTEPQGPVATNTRFEGKGVLQKFVNWLDKTFGDTKKKKSYLESTSSLDSE
ncbi:unnamed protein product [Peronospora farinosa]|uniref:Secreted protein n=1 Tax=Peronospora farinosa TaxID=134698 RepID=A0AAV0TN95_9STRA|nr:unnamed protein product [Peronospora farinosa]CAI5723931.1 unnamed protein product [Peronospora farinosa]